MGLIRQRFIVQIKNVKITDVALPRQLAQSLEQTTTFRTRIAEIAKKHENAIRVLQVALTPPPSTHARARAHTHARRHNTYTYAHALAHAHVDAHAHTRRGPPPATQSHPIPPLILLGRGVAAARGDHPKQRPPKAGSACSVSALRDRAQGDHRRGAHHPTFNLIQLHIQPYRTALAAVQRAPH